MGIVDLKNPDFENLDFENLDFESLDFEIERRIAAGAVAGNRRFIMLRLDMPEVGRPTYSTEASTIQDYLQRSGSERSISRV